VAEIRYDKISFAEIRRIDKMLNLNIWNTLLAAAFARETGVNGVPSSELTMEAEVGTL
jgi:hypothetical protein